MPEETVHAVIDACLLATAVLPESHKSKEVRSRTHDLVRCVENAGWPTLKLYTPSVCVTEAQAVLDKYRYCQWYGEAKKTGKLLSQSRYQRSQSKLVDLLAKRVVETLQLEHDHVMAASLISPINQKYQVRRKTTKSGARVKPPMGGADCTVVGTAIMLAHRLGSQNVVVATADQRMADVLQKAASLSSRAAGELGLRSSAKLLGLKWSPDIYPGAINLKMATHNQLREAFQAWPLPTHSLKTINKDVLGVKNENTLIRIYQHMKSTTKVGVDKLPYSREIHYIRSKFARDTGVYLPSETIYRLLSQWRKSGRMKPKT